MSESGEVNKRRFPMIAQLVAAVVVGCGLGLLLGPKAAVLGELGVLAVRLLKALATPLVFFAIVDSFCRSEIPARKGGQLLLICIVNATVAGALALTLSSVVAPGLRVPTNLMAQNNEAAPPVAMNPLAAIKDLVPESVVEPFSKNNVIAIVLLSVLVGVALRRMRNGGKGETLVRLIEDGFALLTSLLHFIIAVVPFAVAGVIAKVVGTTGFGIFASLGALVGTVTLGLAIHVGVYYALLAFISLRLSPIAFLKKASEPLLTALGTGSSMATLPVTLRALETRFGVSHENARMAACIGTNFNNDGIMLYEVVAALFIAQVNGIHLGLTEQLSLTVTSAIAAAGIAGVPEAGLITLSLVLTSAHLPLSGLPVLLTVDWLLGRFRAATNVSSDIVVASMLQRLSKTAESATPEAAQS